MHVNVVMGGQLDEHFAFLAAHHLYNSIGAPYVIVLYLVWFFRWK